MKNLKKNNWLAGTALILSISLVGTVATPKPAHAIVAAALSGGTALLIVGGGLVAVGGLTLEVGLNTNDPHDDMAAVEPSLFGLLGILAGIVVLDDHQNVTPVYSKLSPEKALSFGLIMNDQVNELNAFNNALDDINGMSQNILAAAMKKSNLSKAELSAFIQKSWKEDMASLEPDAQSALIKIQTGISAAVNAKK